MKRLYVTILFFGVVISTVIIGHCLVIAYTSTMLESFEQIEQAVSNDNYTSAKKEIQVLDEFLRTKEGTLSLFVNRDALNNILIGCSTLKAHANSRLKSEFSAELDKAVTQVTSLRSLFFSFL